jgi:hypothetical protein
MGAYLETVETVAGPWVAALERDAAVRLGLLPGQGEPEHEGEETPDEGRPVEAPEAAGPPDRAEGAGGAEDDRGGSPGL